MKKHLLKNAIFAFAAFCTFASGRLSAQCCTTYDFSSASGWTQVGSGVSVAANAIKFNGSTDGGLPQFVYSTLPTALSNTSWICDFEFSILSGTSGPAHSLLAFTESGSPVVNAHATRPSVNGTITYSNTNAIEVWIHSDPYDTDPTEFILSAGAKVRTGTYGYNVSSPIPWYSTQGIYMPAGSLNTTLYVRLQRLNATTGILSVFTDAARTVLYGVKCFMIPNGVNNLSIIQAGNNPEFAPVRTMNAYVDNVKICNTAPAIVPAGTVNCAATGPVNYTMSNGVGSCVIPDCGFPGSTGFTWSAPAGSVFPAGNTGSCSSGSNVCAIDVNNSGTVSCAITYPCVTITYTMNVTVGAVPLPTSTFTTTSPYCPGEPITVDGSASTNETSYVWSWRECTSNGTPIAPTWTSAPPSNGSAGIFTLPDLPCPKYFLVRLITMNSCGASTSQQVISMVCAPGVDAGPDFNICCWSGLEDIPVTITGVSGTPGISWSPTTDLTCPHGTHTPATCPAPNVRTCTQTTYTDPATGCSASDQVTVTPIACRMSGPGETGDAESSQLSVYPNPATLHATINTGDVLAESIIITDALGREVYNRKPTATQTQVDISGYPAGVYLVRVISSGETQAQQLVIEK
jgi:hypothetical protein